MIQLLLLLSFFAGADPVFKHPLKMCVCDVKALPESGQLRLKFKFFRDDLEATLSRQSGNSIDFQKSGLQNEQVLDAFVRANFQLKINGRSISIRYVKAEIQEPVLIAEWTADGFQTTTAYQVELHNTILLDVFPDQYNLVRFDFFQDGNLETMRFERAERFLTKYIRKR